MRGFVFCLSFLFCVVGTCLTDADIYQKTLEQCRQGTVMSALDLSVSGFKPGNFLKSFNYWFAVNGSANEGSYLRIRSSQDFWRAFADCYGEFNGSINYANLMKQLVDMGHLASESTAFMTARSATLFGAKYWLETYKLYPLASRFVVAGMASLQTQKLVNGIKEVFWPTLSEQDKREMAEIEAKIFAEPNKAIAQAQKFIDKKIIELELEVSNPDLSSEEREIIRLKLEKLKSKKGVKK